MTNTLKNNHVSLMAISTDQSKITDYVDPIAQYRAKAASLTATQICEDKQISNTTLWRMIKRGEFPKPSYLVGTERRWTIPDLEAYDAQQAEKIATK